MAKVTFNDSNTEDGNIIITGADNLNLNPIGKLGDINLGGGNINLNQVAMGKAIAINHNPDADVIGDDVLNFVAAVGNIGAVNVVGQVHGTIQMMPGSTLTFSQPVNGSLTITNGHGNVIDILAGNQLAPCAIKASEGNFKVTFKNSVPKLDILLASYFDFFNHHNDRDNDPDAGAGGCGVLIGEDAQQEIAVY